MTVNNIQIGGTHYHSTYQHWDLCLRLHWGVLEVYITKYASRHKYKNGRQDLEKAVHCAQKMCEVCTNPNVRHAAWPLQGYQLSPSAEDSSAVYEVRRFLAAQNIPLDSTLGKLFVTCARWRGERGASDVLELTQKMVQEWDAEHAAPAQPELNLDGGSSATD